MALLRLSNGRVYTTLSDITSRIGSIRLGAFNYPDSFRRQVEKLPVPLGEEAAQLIFDNLGPKAVELPMKEGLRHRRLGCIIPPQGNETRFVFAFGTSPKDTTPSQMTEEEMRDYLVPHRVMANDWHFVLRGGIIKGMQLEGDQQGVLYVQPGEWIRLNPNAVNWPIFPSGEATIGVSYFDQEPDKFGQELNPEVKIRPDMLY